jgi:hypothetical protein
MQVNLTLPRDKIELYFKMIVNLKLTQCFIDVNLKFIAQLYLSRFSTIYYNKILLKVKILPQYVIC